MIHSRTKIIALVASIIFLLSLIVYVGFWYIVGKHKTTLLEERTRAAETEVHIKALNALEETVRTSADDRKKLSSYVLPNTAIIEFVTDIESIAKGQGVKFTTNQLEEFDVDDTFKELKVEATIEGTFDGVMRMLRILETIPRQSTLQSVAIRREGEGGVWVAGVVLSVTMYARI